MRQGARIQWCTAEIEVPRRNNMEIKTPHPHIKKHWKSQGIELSCDCIIYSLFLFQIDITQISLMVLYFLDLLA